MAARSGKQETRPRRFGTSSEGGSGGSAPARAYCFPAEQTNKATGSFYIRISPCASFSGFVSPSPPGSWPISLNTACRGEGVKREARPRPEGRPRGALLLRCQLSAWIFSAQLLSSAWPCHVGAHRLCPQRPDDTKVSAGGSAFSVRSPRPPPPGSPALGGRSPCIVPTRQVWCPLSAPKAHVAAEGQGVNRGWDRVGRLGQVLARHIRNCRSCHWSFWLSQVALCREPAQGAGV